MVENFVGPIDTQMISYGNIRKREMEKREIFFFTG